MAHCGKSSDREMCVIPIEPPHKNVADNWWDESTNGKLVLKQHAMKNHHGEYLVDWSDMIALDTAGTSGEVKCSQFNFGVVVESLAGAYYRSNLITLGPRYILKNMLHIPITILPLIGSKSDVMQKASQLRQDLSELDKRTKVNLDTNESTIVYSFMNVSLGLEKSYHWISFRVNSARQVEAFNSRWHLVPLNKMGSTYFGEHDGFNETMCGVIEAKVHSSDGASVVSVTHATVPPFRIENRSSDHHLQFVQDHDDAVVFELPPMSTFVVCSFFGYLQYQ